MPIIFRCQSCNQKLSAPSRKAGKTITCPSCGFEFSIPAADGAEPERSLQDDQSQPPQPDESVHEPFSASPREPAVERELVEFSPEFPTPEDDDEGLVLRKADTEFDDMDLTPMVDVTFLLLIFFMITASFSIQKSIRVPPPDPDKEGRSLQVPEQDLEKVSIEITVDEKNAIFVDDELLSDPSGLADAIQSKMRTEQKFELLLTQDPRSLHETTIIVIDAANEAQIRKIQIVTSE